MSSVRIQESRITTDIGRIFSKRWCPEACRNDPAPIVMFHDSLGCVELWRDFPERLALATGRDIVAYDRLGFGRSDPHPGRLDGGFIRSEPHSAFRSLRDQLNIEDFVAFGHSVGGGMAVACAAADPAQCSALITESAQAFVEDRTIQGIRDAKLAFEEPEEFDRLKKYHGDKATWVLNAWIETWLAPDFAGWNLDDDLRRVRCPVLVIHGDSDEFGSVRHPQRIAELTSGHSTVEILADCGHVPHREQSDVVIDKVSRWLARVTR